MKSVNIQEMLNSDVKHSQVYIQFVIFRDFLPILALSVFDFLCVTSRDQFYLVVNFLIFCFLKNFKILIKINKTVKTKKK